MPYPAQPLVERSSGADSVDLSACDREPIHIPGAIQPHGVLVAAEWDGLAVRHVAGDAELRLGIGAGANLGEVLDAALLADAREAAGQPR
ncbi:hypothetical protein SCD90_13410, partial [Terrihabitans sp. PJ23]|nr:hypothetical protein [Terrihabitans sp. PJ23]